MSKVINKKINAQSDLNFNITFSWNIYYISRQPRTKPKKFNTITTHPVFSF